MSATFWRYQESEKTYFPESLQRWETFRDAGVKNFVSIEI